jgi:hypothetical protein
MGTRISIGHESNALSREYGTEEHIPKSFELGDPISDNSMLDKFIDQLLDKNGYIIGSMSPHTFYGDLLSFCLTCKKYLNAYIINGYTKNLIDHKLLSHRSPKKYDRRHRNMIAFFPFYPGYIYSTIDTRKVISINDDESLLDYIIAGFITHSTLSKLSQNGKTFKNIKYLYIKYDGPSFWAVNSSITIQMIAPCFPGLTSLVLNEYSTLDEICNFG